MSEEQENRPIAAAPEPSGQRSLPLRLLEAVLTPFVGPLTLANLYQWVRVIGLAVGFTLLLRWALVEPYQIPSGSMIPTLQIGDRILVNKFTYGLRIPFTKTRLWQGDEPKRWDIIVFRNVNEDSEHPVLVKRVVALPGERVHIEEGKLLINGSVVEVPADVAKVYSETLEHLDPRDRDSMPPGLFYTSSYGMHYGVRQDDEYSLVPPKHYLMLGDNSGQSNDGRYFGWVPNENLLGPVVAIWWPFSHARDLTGFTHTWWWMLLWGIVAVYFITSIFVARTWAIHGAGVGGFLESGDRILVILAAYGLHLPLMNGRVLTWGAPKRGDLVVYHVDDPESQSTQLYVGRVLALSNEKVVSENAQFEVNGESVVAPKSLVEHLDGLRAHQMATPNPECPGESAEFLVPAQSVFIISDELDAGPDSRTLGCIPLARVMGPVSRIVWPLRRWGRVRT